MRYRAEFCMDEANCRLCPFFLRRTEELAVCMLAEYRGEPSAMMSVLVLGHGGKAKEAFPMPIDCPLEAVAIPLQHD